MQKFQSGINKKEDNIFIGFLVGLHDLVLLDKY